MLNGFHGFFGRWYWLGLSGLAFVVKLSLVLLSKGINPDAVRYLNAAHLFSNEEFSAGISTGGQTFLLPWLIQFVQRFISDWVLAGQFVSVVAMSLALIPFCLVTRNLFGERSAIWVGIAFVLSPVLNFYSIEIIRDPLFILFFGWTLWSMLRTLESARSAYAICALVFSVLAFVCRIEAIVIVGFFIVTLMACSVQSSPSRSGYIMSLLLFITLPLISALGIVGIAGDKILSATRFYEVVNYALEVFRLDFLFNYHKIYGMLKEFSQTLPFSQYAHNFGETALHFMPVIYLIGLVYGFISVCYPIFSFLIFYGLVKFRSPSRQHFFCIWLAVVYLATAYAFLIKNNFISERYLLAPVMVLFPWLGAGLDKLIASGRSRPWFLGVLASLFLVFPVGVIVKKISQQDAVIAQAGAWIRENRTPEIQSLLVNDERIALYAGLWRGEYATFGGQNFDNVLNLPQIGTGDWLVYEGSISKRGSIPSLPQFQPVREFVGKRKCVLIFRRI